MIMRVNLDKEGWLIINLIYLIRSVGKELISDFNQLVAWLIAIGKVSPIICSCRKGLGPIYRSVNIEKEISVYRRAAEHRQNIYMYRRRFIGLSSVWPKKTTHSFPKESSLHDRNNQCRWTHWTNLRLSSNRSSRVPQNNRDLWLVHSRHTQGI